MVAHVRTITLLAALSTTGALKLDKAVRPVLKLRGGLAGVDPALAATVGSTLFGINGVVCGLAEGVAAEGYGLTDPSYNIQQMVKSLGYTFASFAVLALSLLKGVPFGSAFGWSVVPWLLLTVSNILNGVPAKMGMPAAGQFVLLAINTASCYCGMTGTAMPLAAKLNAGWTMLNGVMFALMPKMGAKAWGLEEDDKFCAIFKNFGYSLVAMGTLIMATATGVDVSTAVGYGMIPMIASLADGLFVTKGFDTLNADKVPAYVWGVIMATVAALTLA
jgi:hypothetical protein